MKTFILLGTLLSTTSAFAISDVDLIKKCEDKALEKMTQDASFKGCEVLENTLQIHYLNNRFYNPSKYIGYNAEMDCSNEKTSIFMMVEYDALTKECM